MNFQEARVSLNKFVDLLPKLQEAAGRLKSVMDAAAQYEEAAKTADADRRELMTVLAHLQAEVAAAKIEYETEHEAFKAAKAKALADHTANMEGLAKHYNDTKFKINEDIAKLKAEADAQIISIRASVSAEAQAFAAQKAAHAKELHESQAELDKVQDAINELRYERSRLVAKFA